MDWSRAKNILIIALIICNLILTSVYVGQVKTEREKIADLTENAINYVEQKGINIDCAVPNQASDISVINLKFIAGDSAGALARTEFDGIPLEVVGLKSSSFIESIQKTGIELNVLPAYTALLKSLESVTEDIDDLELVYLVDRSAYAGEAGEDTALPYWKLSSGGNSYYYAAYAE